MKSISVFLETDVRFEVLTAVKIQVEVFLIPTPSCVVVGYQCFRVPCCLHLPGPRKRCYTTTTLHSVTTQKTSSWFL